MSNFFIAYKLRDMQNIGTSWKFVLLYFILTLVWTIINLSGTIVKECGQPELFATGYAGFIVMQLINIFLIFTARQNSFNNYKRLPIWLVTCGSTSNLFMLILMEY